MKNTLFLMLCAYHRHRGTSFCNSIFIKLPTNSFTDTTSALAKKELTKFIPASRVRTKCFKKWIMRMLHSSVYVSYPSPLDVFE